MDYLFHWGAILVRYFHYPNFYSLFFFHGNPWSNGRCSATVCPHTRANQHSIRKCFNVIQKYSPACEQKLKIIFTFYWNGFGLIYMECKWIRIVYISNYAVLFVSTLRHCILFVRRFVWEAGKLYCFFCDFGKRFFLQWHGFSRTIKIVAWWCHYGQCSIAFDCC